MRIGVNCINVDPAYRGGVNTYTFGLLRGLGRVASGARVVLYVTPRARELFAEFAAHPAFEIIVVDDPLAVPKKALRRLALATRSQGVYEATLNAAFGNVARLMDRSSDLLYTPTTTLLLYNNRRPNVLSMHDIQQFHFPEFFTPAELAMRRIVYGLSVEHTAWFQASSRFIRDDLVSHYPAIRADRVEVIPEGVDIETFSAPMDADAALTGLGLPKDFLFLPAQLWPHKNHITVLRALARIEREHGARIPLVLTGARYSAADEVLGFISERRMDHVRYLGLVPFDTLLALYRRARFLVTAVLYESSSLPVLEAAASGTPIIASDTPPNRETGETLGLNLFPPKDDAALAEILWRLWNDPDLPRAQAQANRERIHAYSWDNIARRYLSLFDRVVSNAAGS